MLGTLLILALASPGAADSDGEVVATAGVVTLARDGKLYRVEPQSLIRPGDRLETPGGGGASILLPGGGAIDMGPGSVLTLGGADGRAVDLARGEVRAVVAGPPLAMIAAGGRINVDLGIVRASTSAEGARVWAEAGSAEIAGAGGRAIPLAAGQELMLPTGGDPTAPVDARPDGWALQSEALRMATAADSSRRSKQRMAGDANDDVAKTFGPSGQAPDGAEPAEPGTPEEGTPPATPPQTDEATTPTPDDTDSVGENARVTQPVATSAISLALGTSTAAVGAGSSGGDFSDAQQDSRTTATVMRNGQVLPLAGNIHVVAAQSAYTLRDVRLNIRDKFPIEREYWSIGVGPTPKSQVITTFRTGSNIVPDTLRIPRSDAYLVKFPLSNYGIRDPAQGGVGIDVAGISGLTGAVPIAPQVQGATPLLDSRAIFNDRATFALGEFALQRSANDKPRIDIRRGDQDRQIIKSSTGNDQLDIVTLNEQVRFEAAPDFKFFPELPAVSKPAGINPVTNKPIYRDLSPLRKAAATTLLADSLSDFSKRTGRTRYVLGGRVVDISGYRPPNPMRDAMRSPTVGVQGASAASGRATRFGHPR